MGLKLSELRKRFPEFLNITFLLLKNRGNNFTGQKRHKRKSDEGSTYLRGVKFVNATIFFSNCVHFLFPFSCGTITGNKK
ncbi:hypothetical protein FKM82_006553 [Ascaphus truei]